MMNPANVGSTAPWALWTPWTATAQLPPATALTPRTPLAQDCSSIGTSQAPLGLIRRPAPQVAAPAARASTTRPGSTPMQQAQAVVAQAHAAINKLGNSTTPIGQDQARQLVSLVDSTTSQLQAIAEKAGNSDPALTSYVQSTLADLSGARTAYMGLAGDISKDSQQDTQAWQAADQSVLADINEVDQAEAKVVQSFLGGGGDGGGS